MAELIVRIDFPNKKLAKTVYFSLRPETQRHPAYRSNVQLNLSGHVLKLVIKASDIVALRAAANSFLRLIAVAMKTVDILAPFYTAEPERDSQGLQTIE